MRTVKLLLLSLICATAYADNAIEPVFVAAPPERPVVVVRENAVLKITRLFKRIKAEPWFVPFIEANRDPKNITGDRTVFLEGTITNRADLLPEQDLGKGYEYSVSAFSATEHTSQVIVTFPKPIDRPDTVDAEGHSYRFIVVGQLVAGYSVGTENRPSLLPVIRACAITLGYTYMEDKSCMIKYINGRGELGAPAR